MQMFPNLFSYLLTIKTKRGKQATVRQVGRVNQRDLVMTQNLKGSCYLTGFIVLHLNLCCPASLTHKTYIIIIYFGVALTNTQT